MLYFQVKFQQTPLSGPDVRPCGSQGETGASEGRSGAAGVKIVVADLGARVEAECSGAVHHPRAAVVTYVELSAVVLLGEMELGRVRGTND